MIRDTRTEETTRKRIRTRLFFDVSFSREGRTQQGDRHRKGTLQFLDRGEKFRIHRQSAPRGGRAPIYRRTAR